MISPDAVAQAVWWVLEASAAASALMTEGSVVPIRCMFQVAACHTTEPETVTVHQAMPCIHTDSLSIDVRRRTRLIVEEVHAILSAMQRGVFPGQEDRINLQFAVGVPTNERLPHWNHVYRRFLIVRSNQFQARVLVRRQWFGFRA